MFTFKFTVTLRVWLAQKKIQDALEMKTLPTAEDAVLRIPYCVDTTGHMLSWYKSVALLLSQEKCKFTSWEDNTVPFQICWVQMESLYIAKKKKKKGRKAFSLQRQPCSNSSTQPSSFGVYHCEELYQVDLVLVEDTELITDCFGEKDLKKRENIF